MLVLPRILLGSLGLALGFVAFRAGVLTQAFEQSRYRSRLRVSQKGRSLRSAACHTTAK